MSQFCDDFIAFSIKYPLSFVICNIHPRIKSVETKKDSNSTLVLIVSHVFIQRLIDQMEFNPSCIKLKQYQIYPCHIMILLLILALTLGWTSDVLRHSYIYISNTIHFFSFLLRIFYFILHNVRKLIDHRTLLI